MAALAKLFPWSLGFLGLLPLPGLALAISPSPKLRLSPATLAWVSRMGDGDTFWGHQASRHHCRQVQDVVKCQMGACRADESEDSPDSCKNGQLQILVSVEARAGPGQILGTAPLHPPAPGHLPVPSHWGGDREPVIQVQPLTVGWHWTSPSPFTPRVHAGPGRCCGQCHSPAH